MRVDWRMHRHSMYAVLAIILSLHGRKICAFFQYPPRSDARGEMGIAQLPCDVIKIYKREIIDLKFS